MMPWRLPKHFTTEVLQSFFIAGVLITQVLFISTDAATVRQLDHSCPQEPLPCLMEQLGITVKHDCKQDTDCPHGSRCCYRGCGRTCVLWDPCQMVICNAGYTCQPRYSNRTIPEADCVPDEKRLCKPLNCNDPKQCPPGFKTKMDKEGCPSCQCEPKNDCADNGGCRILCAYGLETGPDGCSVCRCRRAPDNPCSNLRCGADEECRLIAPANCRSRPCHPKPQCIPRPVIPVQFDNTCSSWDSSTVHLPVVSLSCSRPHIHNGSTEGEGQEGSSTADGGSGVCELDCRQEACPERTVCVRMGSVRSRCCWQSTQALLLPPARKGECPADVLVVAASAVRNSRRHPHQRCQLDAQCPGQQKCCSRSRYIRHSREASPDTNTNSHDDVDGVVGKTLSVHGFCTDPTHILLDHLALSVKITPPSGPGVAAAP